MIGPSRVPLSTRRPGRRRGPLLSTEEGVRLAEAQLVKVAGAEAARNLLISTAEQHQAILQAEEFQKQAAAQEYAELAAAEELFKNASAEEKAVIVKIANTHRAMLEQIQDPLEKLAYQQGVDDAAAMMDSQGADGAGEPSLPGAQDGPASLEQIAQILIAAVEAGEIDEATAQQVMQELAGAGDAGAGGDPAAGGAPADPAAAGAAPGGPEPLPEGAPEEAKAAAALFQELVVNKK